ncbi:MAG: GNAT family N-acetyltransferase [Chloroflexi bacterium]|nr:GNAT family N-acetyltransferase [Chloroflexota bacterium]
MAISISDMMEVDWPAVSAIYREGIGAGNATFATEPPGSWDEWCTGKINASSLVAREDDVILGWAALSLTSSRWVYRGVAEVSIYVSQNAQGRGIGSCLLQALIDRSETLGIWTLQAGIFPENRASLRLHLEHGFREVGFREKLGQMTIGQRKGQWRDVVLLERRSAVVGICDTVQTPE